jgi:hypothetical protein
MDTITGYEASQEAKTNAVMIRMHSQPTLCQLVRNNKASHSIRYYEVRIEHITCTHKEGKPNYKVIKYIMLSIR